MTEKALSSSLASNYVNNFLRIPIIGAKLNYINKN